MATEPDDIPEGGPYAPGPNRYKGGGTTVDDVSPLPDDRNTGVTEETQDRADSVSRQLS